MNTQIVITGGSGFVGQHLLQHLHQQEVACLAYSRRHLPGLIQIDSYDKIPVSAKSVLVHLAQPRDLNSESDGEEIAVCEKLVAMNWHHIVYISSATVYGDQNDLPRKPHESLMPFNGYTSTKLGCESLVREARGTCLRMSNLYGPGMAQNNVLSDILRQLPGNGAIEVRDGTPIRDFLYVKDAVRAILLACLRKSDKILNVGSGIGTSITELAKLILDIAGKKERSVVSIIGKGRKSHLVLDISETESTLQWTPKIDLKTGLTKTMQGKY